VFTNGCFDLVHAGHLLYLQAARSLGDCLIVGLNSDQSVQRIKGPTRPVVLFDEDTPEQLIREIRPDILVKGGDYRPHQIAGASFVTSYGGSVVLLPYIEGKSTTAIIARICKIICQTTATE